MSNVPHEQFALHNPLQLSCITKSLVDELKRRYFLTRCRFFCFLENHKAILYIPLGVLLHSERNSKKCITNVKRPIMYMLQYNVYLLDILQEFLVRSEQQHLTCIFDQKIIISLLTASSYFISKTDRTENKIKFWKVPKSRAFKSNKSPI